MQSAINRNEQFSKVRSSCKKSDFRTFHRTSWKQVLSNSRCTLRKTISNWQNMYIAKAMRMTKSKLKDSMTSIKCSESKGSWGKEIIFVIHVIVTGLKINGGVVTKSASLIAWRTISKSWFCYLRNIYKYIVSSVDIIELAAHNSLYATVAPWSRCKRHRRHICPRQYHTVSFPHRWH